MLLRTKKNFKKKNAVEKQRSFVKRSRAFPYGTSHRAAALVGPGSIWSLPEKRSQIDIWGSVLAACACCFCPQLWGLRQFSDRVVLVDAVGLGTPKTSGRGGSVSPCPASGAHPWGFGWVPHSKVLKYLFPRDFAF